MTSSNLLDISDLDEAEVLAALHSASGLNGPVGWMLAAMPPTKRETAAGWLQEERSFDYVEGRVLKLGFFDPSREESEDNKPGHLRGAWLYDRDNGEGAVARVLAALRARAAAE